MCSSDLSEKTMTFRAALRIAAPVLLLPFLSRAQQVPRPAPDLTINYPDGQTKHLSDYHGKVVALAFISVVCPHCQHATEILTKMQNELSARGFQVLEVALDPDAKTTVPGFVSQLHPSFPVGFTGDYMSVVRFLALPNQRPLYPLFTIVDRKGVIQFEATGRDDIFANEAGEAQNLRAEVLKVLKEGGHPRASAKARTQG